LVEGLTLLKARGFCILPRFLGYSYFQNTLLEHPVLEICGPC
jgi:hypothetical protein